MCFKCYGNNPERTTNELRLMVADNNDKFDKWNTTLVHSLIISMSGHSGDEAQLLATKMFKKYIEWYKNNKKDRYFPDYGMENMFSISALEEILRIVEDNNKAFGDEKMCEKELDASFYTILGKDNLRGEINKKLGQYNFFPVYVFIGGLLGMSLVYLIKTQCSF